MVQNMCKNWCILFIRQKLFKVWFKVVVRGKRYISQYMREFNSAIKWTLVSCNSTCQFKVTQGPAGQFMIKLFTLSINICPQ